MTQTPTVHAALVAVMRDVQGLGKHQRNSAPGGNYNFRGIDAVPERMWRRLRVTESGCWEWTGASTLGYGRIRWQGRSALAHRVMFELATNACAVEDLDHLCRNSLCVNPSHLEAVSHAENIRRGQWAAGSARKQLSKTECANGHPYTPENTYTPPASSPRQRQCRTCRLDAKRRYNARKAA